MSKPPSGTMVYWRLKGSSFWRFGYVSYTNDADLVRMGSWNGDTTGGFTVSSSEIEWKPY